jgi:hypothetical protein
MSPVAQVNNPQMKDILDSEFQRSSDPSFLARIAVSKYLNLPGVRGFWGPAVKLGAQGGIYATDMTGGTNHMLWADDALFYPQLGRLAWYFDGARYAYNLDQPQWDITAAEAWSGYPGLSLGAWINCTRAHPYAGSEGIITKWSAAVNNYGYVLDLDQNNNNNLSLILSSTGANAYGFDHSKTIARNTWYFVAATFNPGAVLGEVAGVRLWVNDQMQYHAASDRGAAGLPASIFSGNQNFQFGSWGGAANQFLGYQTLWYVCGNYLTEGEVYNIFESTKYLMGYVNEFGTSW